MCIRDRLLIDQESAESLQDRIEALLSPMEYGILQRYLNGENYVQIAEGLERSPCLLYTSRCV